MNALIILKRFMCRLLLFFVFLEAAPVSVLAQQQLPKLIIGQENIFTEFNYSEAWLENIPDPANPNYFFPMPKPENMEAYAAGNSAYVSVFADSGEAARAFAETGVAFELDFGGYSREEVLDWPLRVSFDFFYEISAYWKLGYGTSSAGIAISGFVNGMYDGIGFIIDDSITGTRQESVGLIFTTLPDGQPLVAGDLINGALSLEPGFTVTVYCEARTIAGVQILQSSASSLTLKSITVDFPDVPVSTSTTIVEGNTTTTTTTTTATTTTTSVPETALNTAADFKAFPLKGQPPLDVQFQDISADNIISWYWDFGDSEISAEQNPLHTYIGTGSYTVALSVTDRMGDSDTLIKPGYIRVTKNVPVVDFVAEPTRGEAPLFVQFSDISEGEITERLWNFGDGSYVNGKDPQHTYVIPGTYSVGLRILSQSGPASELKQDYITVEPSAGSGFFYISGQILDFDQEETAVFLGGAEERVTEVQAEGTYAFKGLSPGDYTVTPFRKYVKFTEPSEKVTIVNSDVEAVNFILAPKAISFESAGAEPEIVPADGITPVLFKAQINYLQGAAEAAALVMDLRPIGGEAGQQMYDDATNGDETAGDGIYSFETTVSAGTQPGPKSILIAATGSADDSSRHFETIYLEVKYEVTDTVPMNASQKKNIQNEIEGQTLKISFSLNNETARSAYRAASESSVFLQILDPDNNSQFDSPILFDTRTSEVEVENAAIGTWTFEIENRSSTNRQYSLSVSSAGTGFVNGMIVNAVTGEGIGGISVATNIGSSVVTVEGYYFLVLPAGFYTLSTSDANYKPAAQAVTVAAGETEEVNIVLSAAEPDEPPDDDGCVLSSIFAGARRAEILNSLRAFRDAVLLESKAGRHYVDLYYSYGPEMNNLLHSNAALRREVQKCIKGLLPSFNNIISAKPITFDNKLSGIVKGCLEKILPQASAGLRREIENLIKAIEDKSIYKELGFWPA